MNRVSIPGRSKKLFLYQNVRAGGGGRPASYQMDARCCVLVCKYAFVEYRVTASRLPALMLSIRSHLVLQIMFFLFERVTLQPVFHRSVYHGVFTELVQHLAVRNPVA
jgi:hypothetical protein